ncbi:hypothetical protein ACX0G9_01120 [Flavitalea flava]
MRSTSRISLTSDSTNLSVLFFSLSQYVSAHCIINYFLDGSLTSYKAEPPGTGSIPVMDTVLVRI